MKSRHEPADHRLERPESDDLNWNIPESPEFEQFSNRLEAAFARVVDRWRWYAAPNSTLGPRMTNRDNLPL